VFDEIPAEVEGVRITEEIVVRESGRRRGQRYHRVRVVCPCSTSSHSGGNECGKWRNVSAATTQYFGNLEVWAYLGCWLRRASEEPDRAAHMQYRPTEAEVEEYLAGAGCV